MNATVVQSPAGTPNVPASRHHSSNPPCTAVSSGATSGSTNVPLERHRVELGDGLVLRGEPELRLLGCPVGPEVDRRVVDRLQATGVPGVQPCVVPGVLAQPGQVHRGPFRLPDQVPDDGLGARGEVTVRGVDDDQPHRLPGYRVVDLGGDLQRPGGLGDVLVAGVVDVVQLHLGRRGGRLVGGTRGGPLDDDGAVAERTGALAGGEAGQALPVVRPAAAATGRGEALDAGHAAAAGMVAAPSAASPVDDGQVSSGKSTTCPADGEHPVGGVVAVVDRVDTGGAAVAALDLGAAGGVALPRHRGVGGAGEPVLADVGAALAADPGVTGRATRTRGDRDQGAGGRPATHHRGTGAGLRGLPGPVPARTATAEGGRPGPGRGTDTGGEHALLPDRPRR